MTAVTIERLIHPRRTTPLRLRAVLTAGAGVIAQSVQAARELDAAVSAGAQLRVVNRFASRIGA